MKHHDVGCPWPRDRPRYLGDVGVACGGADRQHGPLIARKEAFTPRTQRGRVDSPWSPWQPARRPGRARARRRRGRGGRPGADDRLGVVHRVPNLPLQEVRLGQILQDRAADAGLPDPRRQRRCPRRVHGRPAEGVGHDDGGDRRGIGSAVISTQSSRAHGAAGEIGHIVIDRRHRSAGAVAWLRRDLRLGDVDRPPLHMLARRRSSPKRCSSRRLPATQRRPAYGTTPGGARDRDRHRGGSHRCELVVVSGTMKISSEAMTLWDAARQADQPGYSCRGWRWGRWGDTAGVLGAAAVAFERAAWRRRPGVEAVGPGARRPEHLQPGLTGAGPGPTCRSRRRDGQLTVDVDQVEGCS